MSYDVVYESYMDKVLEYLQRLTTITPEQFQLIKPYLELRSFDKKVIILNKGDIEDYLSMVISGIVRKYTRSKGRESTIQLATEGHLIQAEISFHERTPSRVIIETIEPTLLVSLRYEGAMKILDEYEFAEDIAIRMLYMMFIIKDQRAYQQLSKNTRERFLDFVNTHPHMLQRVPQKILASYLDIEPETFSRLKHLV